MARMAKTATTAIKPHSMVDDRPRVVPSLLEESSSALLLPEDDEGDEEGTAAPVEAGAFVGVAESAC